MYNNATFISWSQTIECFVFRKQPTCFKKDFFMILFCKTSVLNLGMLDKGDTELGMFNEEGETNWVCSIRERPIGHVGKGETNWLCLISETQLGMFDKDGATNWICLIKREKPNEYPCLIKD